jgi:hypothetical protein
VLVRPRGKIFTEPLPSNDRGIHRHIGFLEGFMNAVEMGSDVMIKKIKLPYA